MYFLATVWNPNETLFKIGFLQIKYYNLLWITAFVVGWFLMKRIFNSEKKTPEQLDSLLIHSLLATMLGARLGHVFFYDWDYYKDHLLEILLPIRERAGSTLFGFIDGYEFTGFTGLASHGATIGMIIAMYFFVRKQKDIKFFWLLDRLTIPFAIGAAAVRLGNFFNSEIVGKIIKEPAFYAVQFIRNTDDLRPSTALGKTGKKTLNAAYDAIENNSQFSDLLASIPYRHPAQLYEAICYVFVFLIVYYIYWKTDLKNKPGFLIGLFFVLLWTVRFFIEFVKERQNALDQSLELLSIGQWLSIPFILLGLYFMFRPVKAAA